MLIDTLTRLLLAAGSVTVTARALWLWHTGKVVTAGRRISLLVIAAAVVPSAIFWLYLLITAPSVGNLRFDAYLSRMSAAWILIALYTLTELIATAEKGRHNGRLPH